MPEQTEFGKWLAVVRKQRGLSQSELGRRIGGVVQATISSWETGLTEPLPAQVFAIEAALGFDGEHRGHLSQYLGYVPLDAALPQKPLVEHINEQTDLAPWAKRVLIGVYHEVSEAPWGEAEERPAEEPLAPPPLGTETITITSDWSVFRLVGRMATEANIEPERVTDFVLAVKEVAAESLAVAGDQEATLRVWLEGEAVICEVQTPGTMDTVGDGEALEAACDLVQLRSSPTGTTIRLHQWPSRTPPGEQEFAAEA